jgi:hypothetical protein
MVTPQFNSPEITGPRFNESMTTPDLNERESFGRAVDIKSTAKAC